MAPPSPPSVATRQSSRMIPDTKPVVSLSCLAKHPARPGDDGERSARLAPPGASGPNGHLGRSQQEAPAGTADLPARCRVGPSASAPGSPHSRCHLGLGHRGSQ